MMIEIAIVVMIETITVVMTETVILTWIEIERKVSLMCLSLLMVCLLCDEILFYERILLLAVF